MKHLVVHFHYVRQQVNDKRLILKYIPSSDQLADSLTKPLPKPPFIVICPSEVLLHTIQLEGGILESC